jgi:hypothetical protein
MCFLFCSWVPHSGMNKGREEEEQQPSEAKARRPKASGPWADGKDRGVGRRKRPLI